MPPRQALVVTTGRRKGHEKELREGIYLVGRSKKCQIRPKNRAVSRRHCAILCIDGKVFIQDIGSKSGTFVNEDRLTQQRRYELSDGDLLRIGRTQFQMKIERSERSIEPSLQTAGQLAAGQVAFKESAETLWEQGDFGPDFEGEAESQPQSGQAAELSSSNILDMLEEEEDTGEKESNSGPITTITSIVEPVDPESLPDSSKGEEDQEVDFVAPGGKKLSDSESVPSYALRQDWDVAGARTFANKMESEPKAKSTAAAPKRLKSSGPKISVDTDLLKNLAIFAALAVLVAVFAWNIYQLVAFEG